MRRCPVVDFNHHSPAYAADKIGMLRAARNESPVAWCEAYGGFWLVTGYEEMRTVALDDDTYSSKHEFDEGTIFKGSGIPPAEFREIPLNLDPPEFYDIRRIFASRFTPRVVDSKRDRIREMVNYCIDRRIETGKIDLVLDIASPVPALVTLELLGIPLADWEKYAEPVHAWVYTPPNSPDRQRVVDDLFELWRVVRDTIEDRKANPKEDLITYFTQARVRGGEPLDDQELFEMAAIVVTGGVDTTTALISNALYYLDSHPELRAKLVDDPVLMQSACEEFLRFYTPVQALARTVTKDTELAGKSIKRGERVLISWMGANHDPQAFDRPDEIILDRFPNRHVAFGVGIHRCMGSNFARAEFCIVLEQILKRMPDYRVVRSAAQAYPSQVLNGWIKIPATFTPGRSMGATL